jgi:putative ABC transport system permease protein
MIKNYLTVSLRILRSHRGYAFINILGLALGMAAFFAMQGWLDTFVYRIDFSFWTLLVVGLLALVISLATVSFQTVRAATANPVDALHHE